MNAALNKSAQKIAAVLIGIVAVFYLSACSYLWARQSRYIFSPATVLRNTPADRGLAFEDVYLTVYTQGNQPERLHAWWVPAPNDSGRTLLYLHGSALNIGANVTHVKRFHKLGFSVFIISYRGYGKSDGSFPTEAQVNEDAEAAWHYLTNDRQIDPAQIVIYGHSLGGAVGIQLALNHPQAGGLIVEATFTSIYDMAMLKKTYSLFPIRLILDQHFDSLSKVDRLSLPVLFMHGTADNLVPADMSRELYARANPPKRLTLIPGGGHNNSAAVGGQLYLDAVQDFADTAIY
ncbi:MAG: alpha/beta fold hydrolase [Desulfobacterales bacterium]|nr:MAG: alpha/beta fold hydrolase [Desulfobacterales bacterium]